MGVPDFTGQTLEAAQIMGEETNWANGASLASPSSIFMLRKIRSMKILLGEAREAESCTAIRKKNKHTN